VGTGFRTRSGAEEKSRPWSAAAGGIALVVRLTPKGGKDGFDGIATLADGSVVLKARVRAAPTEGEANDALRRLIAKASGVPPRDVTLVAGTTARIKRLTIAGDAPALMAALEKLVPTR
jgi:uncharacterized protein YggU (UPF0235/DUF167 family)